MLCLFLAACAAVTLLFLVASLLVIITSDCDLLLTLRTRYGKQPESLAGKVVWITGASSGIGEYIAYRLAQAGCKLVLSARRKEELERVKQACLDSGKGKISEENILVLPLDISQCDAHKGAVQQVLEYFNQVDILMNNAGKSQRAAWMDIELSVDREMFETNVFGQVSLTQEVLPHMIQRKQGHIAVMGSLAGKVGVPMSRSYDGTKFALHGYFESLRNEMGEHNIDVTMICPGPVFSDLFVHAAKGKQGEEVGRVMERTEKRMTTARCAHLSCVALANKSSEVWLTGSPMLLYIYIFQYLPEVGRWIMLRFGTKQLMKMREGK